MGRSSRAPSSPSCAARPACPAATLAVTLALGCLGALASVASAGCDKGKTAATDGEAGASSADGVGATAAVSESPPLLDGFEGEVDVSGKGDKPTDVPVAIALMIKGAKIRADIPEQLAKSGAGPLPGGGKGYGILDSAAKKAYVVLDSNKQVIEVDLDKAAEHLKSFTPPGPRPEPGAAAPPKAPPKITKTGKFDTVAGHKCENWDVATDHREGTVCIAEEGFSWLSIPASVLTGMPADRRWMGELLDGKHFPMRFVGYGPDGATETGRIEVTKIEKKTLPASEFEYPPEYTLIDLEQMMRGFGMGGIGGMGGMGRPGMPPIPPPPPPPK